jgi:hypothetical protein
MLVNPILEVIPVYWYTMAHVPKGIVEKIRKIYFKFLWQGKVGKEGTHWTN